MDETQTEAAETPSAAAPAHVFEGVRSHDEGYCGDAYCTGHTSHMVYCSCGWHEPCYSDYRTRQSDAKIAWLMHVVADLQGAPA